ncbi:hypothetical protein DFH08DRAFT_150421 [Mycena albidolilacea]|uniref:Uncharacterized protein n=1 Tax=Mycena albidolilacea TaxID=1033008 RepID=A0AAD7ESF6_9AGAR|nr:hypothetical protein DFH08DRAFT_150421 [Mycena albidolilacea]
MGLLRGSAESARCLSPAAYRHSSPLPRSPVLYRQARSHPIRIRSLFYSNDIPPFCFPLCASRLSQPRSSRLGLDCADGCLSDEQMRVCIHPLGLPTPIDRRPSIDPSPIYPVRAGHRPPAAIAARIAVVGGGLGVLACGAVPNTGPHHQSGLRNSPRGLGLAEGGMRNECAVRIGGVRTMCISSCASAFLSAPVHLCLYPSLALLLERYHLLSALRFPPATTTLLQTRPRRHTDASQASRTSRWNAAAVSVDFGRWSTTFPDVPVLRRGTVTVRCYRG